jgi:sugar/nucleoside kinase (ribokinase family)
MAGSPRYDVVAMGNALVDVIAQVGDEFVGEHGLVKGTMALIDGAQAEAFYAQMPPAIEMSGGSAGNMIAGVASLGWKAAYIGKVADDQLGRVFRHDIAAVGVDFTVPPATNGAGTGRCLIVVTPDAQRTMQTFLGAGSSLAPGDVDPVLIADAQVVYMEGYLWDPPGAKEAFLKAAAVAHEAGRKVSLTLSDQFCVDRFRREFQNLVANHVDILFANETEITSLYQVATFDEALQAVKGHCEVAALTRSEKGAVILAGGEVHVIDAEPAEVIDTTGAGDLYAAGFLYGYTHGHDIRTCGRMGAICAAEVISHYGARPEVPLAPLVAARLR